MIHLYKILQMNREIQVKQSKVLIQRKNQGKGNEIRLLQLALGLREGSRNLCK